MRWVTLSTDRDLVVLSAVQWRFGFVVQDSTDIWFVDSLMGFNDNDNGNVNDYDNDNGGKVFGDSTVYGSSTTTTTATSTATTTATAITWKLFEILRVHYLVILSTD